MDRKLLVLVGLVSLIALLVCPGYLDLSSAVICADIAFGSGLLVRGVCKEVPDDRTRSEREPMTGNDGRPSGYFVAKQKHDLLEEGFEPLDEAFPYA